MSSAERNRIAPLDVLNFPGAAEGSAQSAHKVQRGYLPSATYSLHWIADPALRSPVANFVRHEREQVGHQIAGMLEHDNPYRKADK